MPSIKKIYDDIIQLKAFGSLGFLEQEQIEKINSEETKLNQFIKQIKLFNERFSNNGWIVYDTLSPNLIKKVNDTYEKNGFDLAEKVLIEYYSSEIEQSLFLLKSNCEEFSIRYGLILKAFEDHKNKRYHASIPLFLMIIDGAVNDFTKSKGFFAEGTDVNVWDCLVGCSNALNKLKTIYCKGRNKTNTEMIDVPYRNGILHGRDLNYDNIFVSSKCIVLLFAIHDWMNSKKNEEFRKEKFNNEQKSVEINKVITEYAEIQKDKKIIDSWKSSKIIVGQTIPESGKYEEYGEYKYIQKVLDVFEYWKKKNYGQLSKLLNEMFKYEKSQGARPRECRKLFENKELIEYKLLQVEDRAISLKRVVMEAKWKSNNEIFTESLDFNVIYKTSEDEISIPNKKNGEWTIKPIQVTALYK